MNLPMDYSIKSSKVRVVEEGGRTTIMSRDEAISIAQSKGMNLVQISFNPSMFPGSICKIIDYAKFKYDQKKKQKEQQKKNKANRQELKEIKFTIRVDDNDKNIKIKHIKEFLDEGDAVKITIALAKREMNRIDFAKNLMKDILAQFDGVAKLDGTPSLDGRNLSCMIKHI